MEKELLVKKIDDAVEALSDKLVDISCTLFGIPTQNPPGNNYREFTDAVGKIMEEIGMEIERVEVPEDRLAELAPDGEGKPRISIFGYLGDKTARPNVHITGHYDVVPEGPGWTTDPYGCEIRDGNIYARGSCDQKSGIVSELIAAMALKQAGVKLKGTLICSTTPDEESGGKAGVGYLVEQGLLDASNTDHVIITECLDYDKICIGHRGTLWFDVNVTGKQCHGSQPREGVNPIEFIQKLLNAIDEDIKPLIQDPTPLPVMPPTSRWTTITPTMLRAGEKVNTVSSEATISFDWRLNPELNLDWAKEKLIACCEKAKAQMPGSDYSITYYEEDNPTLVPENQPLIDALKDAGKIYVGHDMSISLSPGMFDQKYIVQKGGLKSVVAYGPGRLTLAHKSNEFANIEEMKTSAKVMALAACELLGTED